MVVETVGVWNIEGMYTLRLLRLVRLLGTFGRLRFVRVAYCTIGSSLEDLAYVVVWVAALSFVFVAVTAQLAGGLLHACNDGVVPGLAACAGTYGFWEQRGEGDSVLVIMPRAWEQAELHFDSWGMAAFSAAVMYLGGDGTDLTRR